MRAWHLLCPSVFLAVACSAVPPEEELGGSSSSVTSGCSLSRSTILGSVSAPRRQALERGFDWLNASVPYSQSARHEGYRTDCSGFVSMCWQLAAPGGNTTSYMAGASSSRLASLSSLVPADGLVKSGHMMMFVGWNDAAKRSVCVLEQSSTRNDMQFRTRTVASLTSEGYRAIRPDRFAGDTATGAGNESELAAEDAPPARDPGRETNTPTPVDPPGPAACPTAPEACREAFDLAGVACGTINDRCKKLVNCDLVDTFGCSAGTTCSKDRRCRPTATPPAPPQTPTPPPPVAPGPFEGNDGADDTAAESGANANDAGPRATPRSTAGDEGDVDTPASTRRSDDTVTAASAGCSAAPSGTSNTLPLLGLALAAGLVRRRRTR